VFFSSPRTFFQSAPTEFSSDFTSMSSTTATNLAGLWFGELAAAMQGTWQATPPGRGDQRPRKQQKLGSEKKAVLGAAAAGTKAATETKGDVGSCGGAMPDTTAYLLLDRFAPS
jgi:hypothetical protein